MAVRPPSRGSTSFRPMNQRVDAGAGGDGLPDLLGGGLEGDLLAQLEFVRHGRAPSSRSLDTRVDGDDDPVVAAAGGRLVVVAGDQARRRPRSAPRRRRPGRPPRRTAPRRRSRRWRPACRALAAPVISSPTSRTSRAASASSQRAESRSGERPGSGWTAASAAGEITYEAAVARSTRSVSCPCAAPRPARPGRAARASAGGSSPSAGAGRPWRPAWSPSAGSASSASSRARIGSSDTSAAAGSSITATSNMARTP